MEIEFLDDPAEDVPPAQPVAAARSRSWSSWLDVAPVPLFLAASALAAVAPFERFYLVAIKSGGFRETEAFDGWGRVAVTHTGEFAVFGQHGARYGLVAEVLATLGVVVAVCCVLAVLRNLPRPPLAGLAAGGAVVTAALGGCLAMAWLDAAAVIDSAHDIAAPDVGRTLDDQFVFRSEYGAFLWLLVAATGCALLGTALLVRRARTSTGLAGFQ